MNHSKTQSNHKRIDPTPCRRGLICYLLLAFLGGCEDDSASGNRESEAGSMKLLDRGILEDAEIPLEQEQQDMGDAFARDLDEPQTLPDMSTDRDDDGVEDLEDNCPEVFNPDQSDIDADDEGDACAPDDDQDGIPNEWDPAPEDSSWPGRALPDTVYAQTASGLYALDVKSLILQQVADFSFDTEGRHQVTDIAIDRAGVLWAITFNTLWLCHPQTGECRNQARLPFTNFNGLTFVSGSLFGEMKDVLIGIDSAGSWRRLDFLRDILVDELLGVYLNERSSGDAFSIEGVGTFASVKRTGVLNDIIVKVDPTRPSQVTDVLELDGYSSIYGLAGWRGVLFAFDESGAVLAINTETQEVTQLNAQAERWWGAAVSSVIRSNPSSR